MFFFFVLIRRGKGRNLEAAVERASYTEKKRRGLPPHRGRERERRGEEEDAAAATRADGRAAILRFRRTRTPPRKKVCVHVRRLGSAQALPSPVRARRGARTRREGHPHPPLYLVSAAWGPAKGHTAERDASPKETPAQHSGEKRDAHIYVCIYIHIYTYIRAVLRLR